MFVLPLHLAADIHKDESSFDLQFMEGAGKTSDIRGGLGSANILRVSVGEYGTTKK